MIESRQRISSYRVTVISPGRSSEYFDLTLQSLSQEISVEASSHENVGRYSKNVLNVMSNTNKIDQREFSAFLNVDHYIDIAIKPIVAARSRAKQGETGNSLELELRP